MNQETRMGARRARGATHRRARIGPGRLIARTVGELMITAGVLVLLFVVWQLFWTDVLASGTREEARDEIVGEFEERADPERAERYLEGPIAADEDDVPEFEDGGGIGMVYMPAIDAEIPVMEGVEMPTLDLGVLGHYPDTAMPGQVGNFAVAGHRTTWGRPLHDLDQMQAGDAVVVEMPDGWFVYTFERQRIVLPHQTEVIAPVPDEVDEEPTEAWMVLTACHPKYSAAERLIGYASYDRFVPREDGVPDELEGVI